MYKRQRELWPWSADVEITLEANPGTVDATKLGGLRRAGVNRLSFGVQSFHDHHLRTLGRIHSAAQAERALADAHTAGFANINLDLIFALPGQHVDEWAADLERACAQGTTHISAYNLTYEEGTAFHHWRAERRLVPLDEDSEFEMFQLTRRLLAERGFAAYEISNFAPDGLACRHNLNYWRGGDYLGVGAGAHSFERRASLPWGRRWSNAKSPVAYLQRIAATATAEATSEMLDRRQAAGEFVFLNLRCAAGMPTAEFATRFAGEFAAMFPQVVELERDGLLCEAQDHIKLTPKGLLLADSVFASFL